MKASSRFTTFAVALALSSAVSLDAAETDALAPYYAGTYIWKNLDSNVIGRMWLNADGKYFAFYNVGAQATMPDANGPWQVQGREGSYTLRTDGQPWQLCLWPAAPRIAIGAQAARELYAEGGCYDFTPHLADDVWSATDDPLGRHYKFWLVKGR